MTLYDMPRGRSLDHRYMLWAWIGRKYQSLATSGNHLEKNISAGEKKLIMRRKLSPLLQHAAAAWNPAVQADCTPSNRSFVCSYSCANGIKREKRALKWLKPITFVPEQCIGSFKVSNEWTDMWIHCGTRSNSGWGTTFWYLYHILKIYWQHLMNPSQRI